MVDFPVVADLARFDDSVERLPGVVEQHALRRRRIDRSGGQVSVGAAVEHAAAARREDHPPRPGVAGRRNYPHRHHNLAGLQDQRAIFAAQTQCPHRPDPVAALREKDLDTVDHLKHRILKRPHHHDAAAGVDAGQQARPPRRPRPSTVLTGRRRVYGV